MTWILCRYDGGDVPTVLFPNVAVYLLMILSRRGVHVSLTDTEKRNHVTLIDANIAKNLLFSFWLMMKLAEE